MSMYRMIGADGQEYGPIHVETLKQWIAEGRANAHTRILVQGQTEWRDLGTLPEFAEALGTRTGPPSPGKPPRTGESFAGDERANEIAGEVLARDYRFDIGDCFSRGWDLMARNFWLVVGASALITIIAFAASAIPFASLLLLYVLFGGLYWMLLKLLRHGRAELEDAFAGFSAAFVPLMLFSIVYQLLASIGLLLCILPGIYLIVVWSPYASLLIMDKRLDFWPAMEASRKVVSQHWWQMFGFLLLALLINLAGLLACGIGLFITIPWTSAALVVAYEQVFGRVSGAIAVPAGPTPAPETSPTEPPPADPPVSQ
jgi:hypothetical protein